MPIQNECRDIASGYSGDFRIFQQKLLPSQRRQKSRLIFRKYHSIDHISLFKRASQMKMQKVIQKRPQTSAQVY
jgi:hypothetical protein